MTTTSRVDRVLDALGDETRRLVFRRLRKGNRSVRELADGLYVSRPAVSQHIKVLKSAGLIVVRVEGARRLYGVDPSGLKALKEWLDGFWDNTLAAFKQAAEDEQQGLKGSKWQSKTSLTPTRSRRQSTFKPHKT
jgi:DNA-binding transcriptional ArsR family regulator